MIENVKIVCHYDMCAIRPELGAEKSAGGIHLPNTVREQKGFVRTGIIVAVGPGKLAEATGQRLEMPYKEGDRVVYGQTSYGGGEIEVNGEKLDLVGSPTIYCTLQPLTQAAKPAKK